MIAYRKLVAPPGGPDPHYKDGKIVPVKNAQVLITYKCKKCHGDSTKRGGVCPACREE